VLHLLYSHRIAGPAYRLGQEAAKIARGDLTCNVTLRHKDGLTDLRESLNEAARRYRARLAAVKDSLTVLERQSNAVSDLIRRGGDAAALGQAAEEITNSVRNIERGLSDLKT
jgi:methyl-accepting chemotaxis protein